MLSFADYYLRALMVAKGLCKLGVVPGDCMTILSENRPGWVIVGMEILAARVVTVPVYPTSSPGQVESLSHASKNRS